MSKVFISYGSRNRKVAEGLCAHLEAHGIPCWMAPRDISSGTYAGEITRAIKASDIMVAIFSKASHSEHVKNEVNVAFSNGKLILPYCLDETPFDDDLEYWLSAKQRINSSGNTHADFLRIEQIIHERLGETSEVKAAPGLPASPMRKSRLPLILIAVFCVLAIASGLYLLLRNRPPKAPPIDDLVIRTQVQDSNEIIDGESYQTKAPTPKILPADPNADTFTGKITNGYPDGAGTYTFKKSRRIDMHDSQARIADVGDYIIGSWTGGHLNYGEWYGPDGTMKEYIQLGDYPDHEKDRQFESCVTP